MPTHHLPPLLRLLAPVAAFLVVGATALVLFQPPLASAAPPRSAKAVTAEPQVSLKAPAHALTGYKFGLVGRISKAKPKGKTVVLQQFRKGRWTKVATKRLASKKSFRFTVTPATEGSKRYRVVLRTQGRTLDKSPTRSVHVHSLQGIHLPGRHTSTSKHGKQLRTQQFSPHLLPAEVWGALRCIPGAVQVQDGPVTVPTTGLAYWAAIPVYYGTDGEWYQGEGLLALQYNDIVSANGHSMAGWRSIVTHEYSGFGELPTPAGTWWGVFNVVWDRNWEPISTGWSYVHQSTAHGSYCQT